MRSRTRKPRSSSPLRSGKPQAGACFECGDNHRTVPRRLALLAAVASLAGCGGSGDVHMTAVPREALIDAPLRVHADGLHGRATLTLTINRRGRAQVDDAPALPRGRCDAAARVGSAAEFSRRSQARLVPDPVHREDRARAQQGWTHRCDDQRDSAPGGPRRPGPIANACEFRVRRRLLLEPDQAWTGRFGTRRLGGRAHGRLRLQSPGLARLPDARACVLWVSPVCRRRSAAFVSNTSRGL